MFILDLYSFSILYYFLCTGIWPFLCSWEIGVLCDYQSVFIQIYSYDMLHVPSQCAVRTDESEISRACQCVCVCVYYSLLLCVHLKLYLRHNQGKAECRQSVYLQMRSWKSSGHSDQAVVSMIWGLIPSRRDFHLLQSIQTGSEVHQTCYSMSARVISWGVQQLRHAVDHWPPSSVCPVWLLPVCAIMACTGTKCETYSDTAQFKICIGLPILCCHLTF